MTPERLARMRAEMADLVRTRDEATADAENQTAGMREVALFRAANAQGCLGNYALRLLAEVDRYRTLLSRLAVSTQDYECCAVCGALLEEDAHSSDCPWPEVLKEAGL